MNRSIVVCLILIVFLVLACVLLLVLLHAVRRRRWIDAEEEPEAEMPDGGDAQGEESLPENRQAVQKTAPAYQRKMLLTKREWSFYKALKPIADKYGLHVLSKIRMADLVAPQQTDNQSEWYRRFAKIKAKHVDFALANPENLYVLLLIELDDTTHLGGSVTARDNFVDLVYQSVGLPILHISSPDNLEENMIRLLKLEKAE